MSESHEPPDEDSALDKKDDQRPAEPKEPAEEPRRPAASTSEESFSIGFGSNLYPINSAMIRQVMWLGKLLFARSGLLLPPLGLTPQAQQSPNLYTVNFLGQEVGRFAVPRNAFLVLGEEDELRQVEADAPLNPHPLTGERMVWVFWWSLKEVVSRDLFFLSHLEFMAFFTNWLFSKNYVAFWTQARCQQSTLALTEHVPTLAPLRGFFLREMQPLWRVCLDLLRRGGSLRNFPRVLRDYHQLRTTRPQLSPEELSQQLWHTLEDSPPEQALGDLNTPEFRRLASGVIYMHASQAGWSEQLANRLTEAEINGLLQTLVEIGGGVPGARIPLTHEVISRLDAVFMGRTPQDYFDFLRQLLDGKMPDSAPLNAIDRLALLLLGLPAGCAPQAHELDFLRAAEKKTLLGRVAFLTFHTYYGTFEHGPPSKHLLDVRDQTLVDFLDFATHQNALPTWHLGLGHLTELLNSWVRRTPQRVVYMLLRHYFYVLDPLTRVAEAARTDPRRVQRALRSYFLHYAQGSAEGSTRAVPWRRAWWLLEAMAPAERKTVTGLLEAQGAWIRPCEPPTAEQQANALAEFATLFWPYRSPLRESVAAQQ